MKLLYCEDCRDTVQLKFQMRMCYCSKHAGKYLNDGVTAVVTEGCALVGIDNNTFDVAVQRVLHFREELDYRVDFFFCGWLPTIPGEVIFVSTVREVIEYPEEVENPDYRSSNPVSIDI